MKELSLPSGSGINRMCKRAALFLSALTFLFLINLFPISIAHGYTLSPDSGAILFEQISFRGAAYSTVGEITIDLQAARNTGYSTGFINVTNENHEWIVQNLPVMDNAIYDHPTITTRINIGGTANTQLSTLNAYVDYSDMPLTSAPAGAAVGFNVGQSDFYAGGVGDSLLNHATLGPNLADLTFLENYPTFYVYQKGHPNVQAADNQCAPAAVANSLQWLENEKKINVPQDNVPGLRDDVNKGDKSLVGALEKEMDRPVTSRQKGEGVWPYEGKIKYLEKNGLSDKLVVKRKTGDQINWEWIHQEIEHGEDVELDLWYQGPNDGRHYVEVTGVGAILGMPFITHVSDHVQSDKDANDNKGTNKVDFEWMIGNRVLNSNAIVDEVISESVPEPTSLLLLCLGLIGLAGLRRKLQ
jgi:hypothetical protein